MSQFHTHELVDTDNGQRCVVPDCEFSLSSNAVREKVCAAEKAAAWKAYVAERDAARSDDEPMVTWSTSAGPHREPKRVADAWIRYATAKTALRDARRVGGS